MQLHKKYLREAFLTGVDGENANLFVPIYNKMVKNSLISSAYKNKTITMGELFTLVGIVADKQDKAIDKYIGL